VLASALTAGAQDVPVEKYRLENGMTVLLHVDRRLPFASVNIWYRVGTRDDPPRRSGFAHLFEHLMFMGTERVPQGEFDRILETNGGGSSATTGSDQTRYFAWGPASLLPKILWLEAERLEDLPRAMDQAKLDLQRNVVLNEMQQRRDNRPYGRAPLAIQTLLYAPDHPYAGLFGVAEDLQAATVTDVKDFFATYYHPSNASLAVTGDFDPAAVKPLVAQLFGTLPRGSEPSHRSAPAPRPEPVRRGVMYDRVQLAQVSFAYLAPPEYGPGDAETDIVVAILAQGKDSRLYRRLAVADELAAEVDGAKRGGILGSSVRIDVQARAGVDLDRLEQAVGAELARFVADGPTEAELARAKGAIELSRLSDMQHVERKGNALNAYEFHWGEPNSFARDLDRYRSATIASVKTAARGLLEGSGRVVHRVLPERAARGANGPRDEAPADASQAAFTPPLPERFALSNGIPVQLWRVGGVPLVSVTLLLQPGGPLASAPEEAGLPALVATLMREGAGARDAAQFAQAVAALGGQIETSASHEALSARLTVLSRNFRAGTGLLADAVRRPRFDPGDFARATRVALDEVRQSDDQSSRVAMRVARRLLLGARHPHAWPLHGTTESVSAFTVEGARRALARIARPDAAAILVAADVSASDARTALDAAFGDWRAAGPPAAPIEVPATSPREPGLRVFVVDRPGATQTVVRFAAAAPRFDDPSRLRLRLLHTILGGTFTSRLMDNLREKHGYTYGAYAAYGAGRSLGTSEAFASVASAVTGAATRELLAELTRLATGDVSEDEARKAREQVRNEIVGSFMWTEGILGGAATLAQSGAGFEALTADFAALDAETAQSLNATARTAISVEQGVLVLVGDKQVVLAQAKEIGLPTPIEVDAWGVPREDAGRRAGYAWEAGEAAQSSGRLTEGRGREGLRLRGFRLCRGGESGGVPCSWRWRTPRVRRLEPRFALSDQIRYADGMKTLSVTHVARNFSSVLDIVEHEQDEVVLVRNEKPIARLVPEPQRQDALTVFGDLYRTLDDATADELSAAIGAGRKRRRGRIAELRNPWAG
jgi:predicted Zn-dependent peptidase/antitoxin (DNA-binding transcriptional repressor) of toxin-antitoxin stability system